MTLDGRKTFRARERRRQNARHRRQADGVYRRLDAVGNRLPARFRVRQRRTWRHHALSLRCRSLSLTATRARVARRVTSAPSNATRTSTAHEDITFICGTIGGRWSSRRAPFVAATLVTAQLVVPHPHSSAHSHTHTTQRTAPLSHSPLHAHKHTQARSRTRKAAGGETALVQSRGWRASCTQLVLARVG